MPNSLASAEIVVDRAVAVQIDEVSVVVVPVFQSGMSAFIRGHIGLDGHYAFHLPDLGGTHRPLRDPDAPEED
ncbi:hypothetical protein [Nocardia sp. CY41]|uniref:hypothetical protein n=1 Tax=Nocardia sp. CY41 TaxID=2608686 RepID=UPI001F2EF5C2|nr:hypothetical protein [Nocardia sp. CY41]